MSAPLVSEGTVAVTAPAPIARRRGGWRNVVASRSVVFGGGVIIVVVALALLAPVIAPYDPDQIGAGRRLTPPDLQFLLGTDEYGRDIFSRLIYGSGYTLYIGTVAVGIGLACGVTIGTVAAYAGGWFGGLLMRAIDLLYTFPDVLIALGLVAFLGPNLTNAMVAVGLSAVPYYARVTYGVVLSERQKPYVDAVRVVGASHVRVIVRHLLPNVLAPMIVVASLGFSAAVLSAAALSFLGLGAQPPTPEWGLMLSTGRNYITRAPWLVIAPGIAIFITVVAFNIFGDGVRDLLDPRAEAANLMSPDAVAISGTTSLLAVEALTLGFGHAATRVVALDSVSFDLQRGETLALVGESGSGKSLTALSIMGLLPPGGHVVAGRVMLDSENLLTKTPAELVRMRGHRIAIVFQEPMTSLNPVLTIGRQLTEGMEIHLGMTRAQADARALELLALVGMTDPARRLRQYPHQLSGGMRQRVMIAMALACNPDLIIADEPTTALDVSIQAQIIDLFRDIKARVGTAILLITHDLGVVAEMADRIAVLYAGHVVEIATAMELFDAPRHPYTESLLAAVPRLDQLLADGPERPRLAELAGSVPAISERPSGCPFRPRCRLAMDRCAEAMPPMTPLSMTRSVACWVRAA